MASTTKLHAFAVGLPAPDELERRFRVLGILDAILTDSGFRYSYSLRFLGAEQRVGRYDNGGGDNIYAFFSEAGAFLRAFDHEDEMSPYSEDELWPGLLEGVPSELEKFTSIPQIHDEEAYPAITLALWHTGTGWQHGNPGPTEEGDEPEPTTWMFELLAGDFTAEEVAASINDYYGSSLEAAAFEPFLQCQPLTRDRVLAVNSDPNWDVLGKVAAAAGYPTEL